MHFQNLLILSAILLTVDGKKVTPKNEVEPKQSDVESAIKKHPHENHALSSTPVSCAHTTSSPIGVDKGGITTSSPPTQKTKSIVKPRKKTRNKHKGKSTTTTATTSIPESTPAPTERPYMTPMRIGMLISGIICIAIVSSMCFCILGKNFAPVEPAPNLGRYRRRWRSLNSFSVTFPESMEMDELPERSQ